MAVPNLTQNDNEREAVYRTCQAWAIICGVSANAPDGTDPMPMLQKKIAQSIIDFANSGGVSPGTGTVSSFSAGSLAPIFTTSVADASTTPVLSFTLTPVAPNLILAGPAGGTASAPPSYRALVPGDLPSFSGTFQPLNQKLTAISALANSAGWLTNDGSGIFSYSTLVVDAPLTGAGTAASHLSIPAATGGVNGYLKSADWTTFNNKVGPGLITGSGLTMNTARLLGRTTAAAGAIEELTAGTSLSLTAGSLNTIQDIRTTATPRFERMGLGGAASATIGLNLVSAFTLGVSTAQGALIAPVFTASNTFQVSNGMRISPAVVTNFSGYISRALEIINNNFSGSSTVAAAVGISITSINAATNNIAIEVSSTGGIVLLGDATEATTPTAASLTVAGGLGVSKKIITNSSITTGTPGGSGSGAWKLGTQVAGAFTVDPTKSVEIDIGGTLLKLAVIA